MAMVPVKVLHTDTAPGSLGTHADGMRATCSRCGACAAVAYAADRPKAWAGREAIRQLARECPEDAAHWHFPDRLPEGVRLEWGWRGRRLPLHLVGTKLVGGGGPIGKACPVFVVVDAGDAEAAAGRVFGRLRSRGYEVRFDLRPATAGGAR